MKISKRQLRRIIKEEKRQIFKEIQAVPKIPSKPEFGTMDIKDAIIEDAIDDFHSSRMSKAEVVSGLANQYSMSVGEIESILATDDRWDMLAETKYIMSKTKIRQIIKEEKAKLLRESVTDMSRFEDTVKQAMELVSERFREDMFELLDEGMLDDLDVTDPEMSINEATGQVYIQLKRVINEVVQKIEADLIGGRYG
tara:strand:- start:2148 stop:2738 length:591 start_codon:yes stop_codon:yes gene_type:complete